MTRYEIMLEKEPEKVDEIEPTGQAVFNITCSFDYSFYERRIMAALGIPQEILNQGGDK